LGLSHCHTLRPKEHTCTFILAYTLQVLWIVAKRRTTFDVAFDIIWNENYNPIRLPSGDLLSV